MEIQRQFYLDELLRKRGNGFVKIITGLRRCGKSYLLRTIFKNHLLGAIEIGHAADKIIVKSENFWYPEGEKVTVNGDWIYHLPSGNLSMEK